MSVPTSPATGDGTPPGTGGAYTVELFVRSLSPSHDGGHAETVLRGLDALETVLDDYTVHVWGGAVGLDGPLAETDHARFVLDRVSTFREWASANDVSLLGFETRESHCEFTGQDCRALSLPAVTLAEFHDEELVGVTPCRTADGVHNVGDRIEELAAVESADGADPLLAD
jgi:hypothetical protein